tara:strand:- start:12411 stop:13106 length:696 start_codon:yes stop_codon:yes gene_type:complete
MELQLAYLLHSRPYRNTSLLANFFTLEFGRVDAVVRGVRSEKSKIRHLLQPFTPLLVSWVGKGELVTMTQVESQSSIAGLTGDSILYGFYINELLMRLLRAHDPYEGLYHEYEALLLKFQNKQTTEAALRMFEKCLLQEIGYGLELCYDCESGDAVEPDQWYQYVPDKGPSLIAANSAHKQKAFSGRNLLALHHDELDTDDVLRDAKRLMRHAFARLLGDKPLKSRELFMR